MSKEPSPLPLLNLTLALLLSFLKVIFLCLYMWEDMSATECKQRSHYNFWELGFFYHRDQNQVIGLSTGAFTWLSHIAHPGYL